jgi:hypothetical protein
MRSLVLSVIYIVLLNIPASAQDIATFNDYYNGKRYDAKVSRAQLDQTPSWPAADPHPPLSPRKAMELASAYLPTLIGQAKEWGFDNLTLVRPGADDKWVYLVKFLGPLPPGIADGLVPSMRVVVLMSGKIIDPVISIYKFPQAHRQRSRDSRHKVV